ncbi:Pyranose dehydrogenase 3 [Hypsizygus marmoreus]|uniref:Pyranose dehydrogenase 3 n=1 Tax=Hypsizygus marmoreus TaxID=39966 RepID=A0A369J312_HYPMA|nr:Pyranose dehydrogenase 3 [Hypsizygus marmoreus]
MLHQSKVLHMWLVFVTTFLRVTFAVVVERVTDLPGLEYDFIIVGGGTAGLVVANRLTENPAHSVLVLEAGGSNENVYNSKVPFYNGRLFNTAADWNFTTTPMPGLGGRSMGYPSGHILGGTSSMNGLAYTRGSSDDYNRYARLTGDPGWSWDRVQPYFRKNEHWTEPADHHNTTGQFNPAVHGFHGVNAVSLPGFIYSFDHRVIQATSELPQEFPFNLDMNSGNQIGIGWTQSTIKAGERSSSATSYLAPKYARRRNLHILLHARVSRVLRTGSSNGLPIFKSVEFGNDRSLDAPRKRVTARKEVILSSGAIGTPHILQNSGIGDIQHLRSVGITPLVHLPSVGQNLTDHPFVANTWRVNSTDTFETAIRNATIAEEQERLWNEMRMGPYAASTFNVAGWLRVPENESASVFKEFMDPAAGPGSAHFEFIIANGATRLPVPETGNFMVIGTVVVTPLSRGTVLATSSDPFRPPNINPNLLSSPLDLAIMRSAIRAARRFTQAPVWSSYILGLEDKAVTDAELDTFIRGAAITVSHEVGTAAMSPRGADWGVVDPDLRVKKVKGLRVVDASVLPLVPAAHTQAATYVVAERASDLIKATWT